ncbi:MBL fold metallo-hydrolase [uncultured Lutibacter sp.]|uniref:MBL fold metallo-hydrolase n=1 Tax=uncultured Lutibacter sp. TaxID=437739 RepID=UPI00260C53D5|nr:MBL fold metallo-hydrolase [uncultured Lutibacter sp.]
MKLKTISLFILFLISNFSWSQNSTIETHKTNNGEIKIKPILHSSFVLTYNNKTVYVDPYGGANLYVGLKSPDIILITDTHGDHLDLATLDSLDTSKAIFIAPKAVKDQLKGTYFDKTEVLANGQGIHRLGFFIKAISMYNLPEEADSKHPKGRGNGYILTVDNKNIYISGDTEDIPEMRMLQNIDIAFICMNLPYTMDIKQAASAVLEFQPKIVYPFHYRGKDGFSDVKEFKNSVNSKNNTIDVRLLKWYPTN